MIIVPTGGYEGCTNNSTCQPYRPPPVLAGVSSVVTNATRALLPFVPLIAEAPALAEHARRAWPWARAGWAWSRPFAFVGALHPLASNTNVALASAWCRPAAGAAGKLRSIDAETSEHLDCSTGGSCVDSAAAALDRRAMIRSMAVRLVGFGGTALLASSVTHPKAVAMAATKEEGGEGLHSEYSFAKEGSYDEFADNYDDLDGGWAASVLGIEELRTRLLKRATGRVLEVGVGTGLNLPHYTRDSVSAIDAVDLSMGMLNRASARSKSLGMAGLTRLRQMDVEDLKFPSGTFDTVVDTFSLCVFSNPSAALREMARVCKPTGRVLLLENSKSDFGPLAAYQDLTASYLVGAGRAKGCFWNQDVEALARQAGLRVQSSNPALPGGLFRSLECVPLSALN